MDKLLNDINKLLTFWEEYSLVTSLNSYTSDSIQTVKNLAVIRLRPRAYVGSIDVKGQFHAIKELIDNCIDELEENNGGFLNIIFFNDSYNKTYQVMISDNGRGIPTEKLISCFTVMNTSGKYDNNSYQYSGGQLGIGAKAATGLSKYLRAVTIRPNKISTFCIHDANITSHIEQENINKLSTGTIVYFELDGNFFEQLDIGLTECSNMTIDLLKKFKLFMKNTNFSVYESKQPLDKYIWGNISIDEFVNFHNNVLSKSMFQIYASSENEDEQKIEYLKELWNIDTSIRWNLNLEYEVKPGDNLGYQIQMYLPKRIRSIGYTLSMVNHIVMHDVVSSHIEGIQDIVKEKLSGFIEDRELKKFLFENYKLPVFLAIYVKYKGAQFSGTTKTAFIDRIFLKQYKEMILKELEKYGPDIWEELFAYISDDLESTYNRFFNKSIKIKQFKFSILDLNFPNKYADCKSKEDAELFIVEGDSGGTAIVGKRDAEFQAVYKTKGKPCNAMLTINERKASLKILLKDMMYQDIIKIIGIHPDDLDVSKSNFKRICLTMDADQDGQYIISSHIGNLYIANPNIITSGMLRIIKPPLYTLHIGKKGKIFLQDRMALIDTCIEHIYNKSLDIKLLDFSTNTEKNLDEKTFRDMCFLIIKIGDLIYEFVDKLAIKSDELSTDVAALILEKLIYVINYLDPINFNLDKVQEVFIGYPIRYKDEVLTISINEIDVNILLYDFNKLIYGNILPILNSIKWKQLGLLVTTKYTKLYNKQLFSFVGVYNLFQSLNQLFKVDRYKGLGEMDKEDLRISCIDPNTRTSQHVVTLGDVEKIYAFLGSNISDRKNILFNNNEYTDTEY